MSIASVFGKPTAYYGTHPTVTCPDCGFAADADFEDHGGDCLADVLHASPITALGIIRRHALHNLHFSAEDVRAEMDRYGIKESSRGPAFGAAANAKHRYIEHDGHRKSTGGTAKGAYLQTYTSLIYLPAQQRASA